MHALLSLILLAAPSNGTIGNDLSAGGTSSASKVTSAGTVEGMRLSYPAPTADTAAVPVTVKAGNPSSLATATAGAMTVIGAGETNVLITFSDVSSAGKTLTIRRTVDGVTPSDTVWTVDTQFDCSAAKGSTTATCACGLYTYCNANKPSGVEGCYRTDGTCSDSKVWFHFVDATTVNTSVVSNDNTKMVSTRATAGTIAFAPSNISNTAAWPLLQMWPATLGWYFGIPIATVYTSRLVMALGSGGSLYASNNGGYAGVFADPAGTLGWYNRGAFRASADGAAYYAKVTDTGRIGFDVTGTVKGQTGTIKAVAADCTFAGGGGAASCTTAAFIPIGSNVIGVSGRQTSANTTCTTCTAGADMGGGADADQYGTALECDVDNTLYTTATATANVMGTCYLAGGCTITMTAVGGNCVGGVAAWTVYYFDATAATSD